MWEGIRCSGWKFFHTDLGAIAVVPKFRRNESVDASAQRTDFSSQATMVTLRISAQLPVCPNFSTMDLSTHLVQWMDFFQLDSELILA